MENRIYIDRNWKFTAYFSEEMTKASYDESAMEEVMIPHSVAVTPLHYFDESIYQKVSCYRRHFTADKGWEGKTVLLTFEGVAHEACVYVNGKYAAKHTCGYTAFTVDISTFIEYGADNVIAVRVDSRETCDQPPFGFAIDYMTYGGIYRDVYLEVKAASYISRTSIETRLNDKYETNGVRFCRKGAVIAKAYTENVTAGQKVVAYIGKPGDNEYTAGSGTDAETGYTQITVYIEDVELWDPDNPALYELVLELKDADGKVIDTHKDTFGFRKAVFRANGFFINGRRFKIRGLNRHQSYAYNGYAVSDSMQRLDARILKKELGVNAVRTSHYPQAQSFMDECDRLGLLVFCEIPGWQHIGGDEWKDKAVDNVRDMIRQNLNHPSIVLWGVRINESADDEELYARTNAMAHAEDPSRQTGGVRCHKKGIFQEDVFTYNDFSHYGTNEGCEKKSSVTPDSSKPYLITEYNGHMFPTKAFDSEDHRTEHMLRHARVLDAVAASDDIAGSFGWCMFDYNTHKDFGSGDRICYHGVCDMFRNPKIAGYVYAAQQDDTPVLEVSSAMNIGEHPGGIPGDVYIITNADSVRMYRNDELLKEYSGADAQFKNLKHPPIRIDDLVGDALTVHEGMDSRKAEEVKKLLNEVAGQGMFRLSLSFMARAGFIAARYRMSYDDVVNLYGKYIGNWGGKAVRYRFEAVKDGNVVKSLIIGTSTQMHIEAYPDTDILHDDKTYDMALVRLRAADENGRVLCFCNDPVSFSTEGPIEVAGPLTASLSGGLGGVYVRTTGKGHARLSIRDDRGRITDVEFEVEGTSDEENSH